MARSTLGLALAGVVTLAVAEPAAACSPIIVPLSVLYAGPTIAAMVVGAGVGLALVVAVKCGVFAALCRELHPARAAYLMFLANVVTTFLGIAIALGPASGGALSLPALILVIWAAIRASDHLDRRRSVAGALIFLFLLSFWFWGFAAFMLDAGGSATAYWAFKLAYTACAVTVGFVMTAAWEAYLVQKWSLKPARHDKHGRASERGGKPRSLLNRELLRAARAERERPSPRILHAAFWANAVTFGLVAIAGAAVALPTRLKSPDFLIGIAKRIAEAFA